MNGTGFSGGISRRFFIGGAVAFGARAVFGAQKMKAGLALERPKLCFGVITDIHFDNHSEKAKTAASVTRFMLPLAGLADGDVALSVVPVSSFGKKGRPLAVRA